MEIHTHLQFKIINATDKYDHTHIYAYNIYSIICVVLRINTRQKSKGKKKKIVQVGVL